jgi:hypothetical protein
MHYSCLVLSCHYYVEYVGMGGGDTNVLSC